ncbi:TetR/AcrR family transcriptional regulator [Cytobacillus spongiae]|jgi:AcrR family transcriptional regulator|uniref:TetR/AcrR family transcriptional regulator n=1 Tax=Cytobacillus spongiae TaxID=2901381 RepID=UPI001F344646|nr:TetR/AcrR family transcriptional regulator [Cytobacillus spongiae]UII55832.1 TetR/AcrR family transcriptional regulator [Cytobacillus spongiae]
MRGFSASEKQQIRSKLLQKGYELFSALGLKKTSIKELTEAVGIAQGSFYLFFQSKEVLYFRILEQEEEKIKELVVKELYSPVNVERLSHFLIKGIQLVRANHFIRRLYFEGEMELLIRKLPKEIVEFHIQKDHDVLAPLLASLGMEEKLINIFTHATRAFFLLTLHEKEIGEENYEETIAFIARAIASEALKGVGLDD